jgi:ribosome-associated protein
MPERLPIRGSLSLPLEEVELRTSRSSGPGGQHANVTASRVEAVFDVDASPTLSEAQKRRITERLGPRVTAAAQDTRSQARNRDLALARLAERLAAALVVARPRTKTKPSRGAKQRRLAAKKQRGETKQRRRRPVDE